jgi:hypothetical protein
VLAAIACAAAGDVAPPQGWRLGARLPRIACVVLVVWGGTALTVACVAWLLERLAGRPLDAGEFATVRTTTLAAATLALAWLSRVLAAVEAGWIVYPMLLVTGAGVALRDLGVARPSLLVVALGAYGTTLIFAPRLLRQIQRGTTATEHRAA